MITHAWTVLCEKVFEDHESGNATLVGTFGNISTEVPEDYDGGRVRIAISCNLMSMWIGEGAGTSSAFMRVRYSTPAGDLSVLSEDEEVTLAENMYHKSRGIVDHVIAESNGLHHFLIELRQSGSDEWVEVAKLPLVIDLQSEN